jgi:predicted nicotinamide N-methyase
MWIAKHRKALKRKRVLVIGAGCGLAGLTTALCTTAKHVVITDGDEGAVASLKANIELNQDDFTAKKVSAQRLIFGECSETLKRFDWIIAADVFDIDLDALMKTLRHYLNPNGKALMFAPVNRPSLKSFLCTAKLLFARIDVSRDYDAEVTKALHGMSCFPMMVWLKRERKSNVPDVPRASTQLRASPEMISDFCDEAAPTEVVRAASREKTPNCRRKPTEAKPLQSRQHSKRREASVVEAPRRDNQRTPTSELEGSTLEIETRESVTPSESRLPDLTGSRCSSTKSLNSLAAAELSSLSFGPTRHGADAGVAVCSVGVQRPTSRSSRSTPGSSVVSAVETTSAVGGFWARFPSDGCSDAAEGSADKEKWRKRSQSERRSKSEDCLEFDLCIAGSGLAIQRCSGAEIRGKLRGAQCIPRMPPRPPLVRT